VTAYNQGTNAMRAAVRQLKTRDIATIINRYRGRTYGFAGRNFYCAFVAVIEVSSEYERYFGDLAIESPHQLNQHTVAKSAPLKTIARELGVEANTLAELNPHLRRPAVTSSARLPSGTVLHLPATVTENR
jgi:membrane-bound lytic murein transglycosylase D